MVNIDKEGINKIDLTELSKFITDKEARDFFLAEIGEHYKLLAYLSTQFEGQLFCDVGTNIGCSALALMYANTDIDREWNQVLSYDIVNNRRLKKIPDSILCESEFIISEDYFLDLLPASLIFLDTVHDGIHERKVIDFLIKHKWEGVLILDDIHYFPEQNKLWKDIKLKKEDITDRGHWSGTGIIYFD